MKPGSTLLWRLAAASSLALILSLTLFPTRGTSPPTGLCLICGSRGSADAILNVGLFVPFGLALWRLFPSGWMTVLASAFLTVGIEILQNFVPGRHPAPADVLFNICGGALGAYLGRAWSETRATNQGSARWPAYAAAGFAGLCFVGTALLLSPQYPDDGPYWALIPPPTSNGFEPYSGEVVGVWIGESPIPWGRLEHSAEVRGALRNGATIDVRYVAGRPPEALSMLLRIEDQVEERWREILLVGVDGATMVFKRRTVGAGLRFDVPSLRLRDGLDGIAEGGPLRLTVYRGGDATCLRANEREACLPGPSIGRGWALLYADFQRHPLAATILNLVWVASLLLPVGFLSGWTRALLSAGGLALALAVVIPMFTILGPTPVLEVLSGGAGLAVGAGLRATTSSSPFRIS